MVLTLASKVFLLILALFILFVFVFFILVILRYHRAQFWSEFLERGTSRRTATGDINYWYFVVRDIDQILNMTDLHNPEQASRVEPTATGFRVLGGDFEVQFERIRSGSIEEQDYMPTFVKRKIYAWEVGQPRYTRKPYRIGTKRPQMAEEEKRRV